MADGHAGREEVARWQGNAGDGGNLVTAPVVVAESIGGHMPRTLALEAELSDGRFLFVEWMDAYSATTLSIAADGESEPLPCVDSETGLAAEVVARMRAEVTTLAEEWHEERHREDNAYDAGVWPVGGCP